MFNESIFKKRVVYELDMENFYRAIENLDYKEYNEFRSDFLSRAIREGMTSNTGDAKDKYWSRLIAKIKEQYKFVVPVSNSSSAIQKRHQRMG